MIITFTLVVEAHLFLLHPNLLVLRMALRFRETRLDLPFLLINRKDSLGDEFQRYHELIHHY
jgi:hypothetical protein